MTIALLVVCAGVTGWLIGWHHARIQTRRHNWQLHTWDAVIRHPSMYRRPHRTHLRLINSDGQYLEHGDGGAA